MDGELLIVNDKLLDTDKSVGVGRCISCRFWTVKDNPNDKDEDLIGMGLCRKMSSPDGESYPDIKVTGIDGSPICIHDGCMFTIDTKSWFGCVHYES